MLGLYEFNRLSDDQQYSYVFEHGRFLASYVEDEIFTANLYHTGGFFVEVWYNAADNCIEGCRSFRTHQLLEPYLEGITIESLF